MRSTPPRPAYVERRHRRAGRTTWCGAVYQAAPAIRGSPGLSVEIRARRCGGGVSAVCCKTRLRPPHDDASSRRRRFAQYRFIPSLAACADGRRPSSVLAPVESPPWSLQRPRDGVFYISPSGYHFKNASIFSSGQQLMMFALPAHPRRAWARRTGGRRGAQRRGHRSQWTSSPPPRRIS
jgi:hypothetical protein